MCSGKSTLGQAVSAATGVAYVDLDQAVEQRAGMPLSRFIPCAGEAAFRELESSVLAELLASGEPLLVALGGGTPCRPGVMEQLNSCGVTVWLEAGGERLMNRIREGLEKRPLLKAIPSAELPGQVERMLEQRKSFYSLAQLRFDSSFLETPKEIQESVNKFIKMIKEHQAHLTN